MPKLQVPFKRPQHKYAINAALLGDPHNCAWSNLGLWTQSSSSYVDACEALAAELADSVHLNAKDKVLDLGCGQGASLILWKEKYLVKYLEAIELQNEHVLKNQKFLPHVDKIHQGSFLELDPAQFEFKFDAALCIDAAYHSDLNSFLSAVNGVLNSKGRLAFHYLVLSDRYLNLNALDKIKLKFLLKSADVQLDHLKTTAQLNNVCEQYGYEMLNIENISEAVFAGFADYVKSATFKKQIKNTPHHFIDLIKIKLTAKLCAKLYADGLVEYTQISLRKK